jgi:hypothetical protein
MSTYYNRFGGYPLGSEEFTFREKSTEVKLLVTYRYPFQNEQTDSTRLNISVKITIPKAELKHLQVDRLALLAADSSYMYTYANPAIYDSYGKYPIKTYATNSASTGERSLSDEICLFTVNRMTSKYDLIISYKTAETEGVWQPGEKRFPIDISDISYRVKTLPVSVPDSDTFD